jgi:hypothetical protein
MGHLMLLRLLVLLLLLTAATPASWLRINEGITFAARNGHAMAVFKGMLWVTGGRSELYQEYNLQQSHRRGDVWNRFVTIGSSQ